MSNYDYFRPARQRGVFIKQASEELGIKEDVIRRELGHVLLKLEAEAEGLAAANSPLFCRYQTHR